MTERFGLGEHHQRRRPQVRIVQTHHLLSGEAFQVGLLNAAHVHALATRPDLLQQSCFVCCTVHVAGRSKQRPSVLALMFL